MTGHVVVDHHHDTAAGVYRIVVGVPIFATVTVLDADGSALVDDGEPVTEERVVDYADAHEVVWDDGDERWWKSGRRRAAGDIAAEQRAEVAAAIGDTLAGAEAEFEAAMAARKPMPGAGGLLAEGSDTGRG